MTIEIANRLLELRKANGLSQEELAEKLGLSRQAISKWERAEASPDTDNLICLAKLYGVSLDELLKSDDSLEDLAEETRADYEETEEETSETKEANKQSIYMGDEGIHIVDDDGDEIHIDNHGIHIKDKDGEHVHWHDGCCHSHHRHSLVSEILHSIYPVLVIIAYLVLGFTVSWGWHPGWILFLTIPVFSSFIEAIEHRRFTKFAYPILVVVVYLVLGFIVPWGWGLGWIGFLTIPVYYIIFKPIDNHIHGRRFLDDDDED